MIAVDIFFWEIFQKANLVNFNFHLLLRYYALMYLFTN